jgi:hypothetical protein
VKPIIGVTIVQSVDPRGARLNSIVLTYRATGRDGAATGDAATVRAPFKITWPNPGKPCG